MTEFAPGTVLGDRFEVHGVIGRGGTATVVLATDRLRGESVALKVVHAHLAADPATRRRLQREVRTAAVLRASAALVPYDLHEFGGRLALSMPFHPGQSLTERVAGAGALPADEVRAVGIRVATALAEAHRVGLLHRDVTANNVLVGDRPEEAVLTDFGLARLQAGTRSTGLLGTAGYAAPEVYAGERADPRSDLYGLGAVLYLAITGRPAFDPAQPAAALKQQLDGTVRPVLELRPDCPPDLAATIVRLLAPDPADRPQGAAEVIDALTARRAPEPVASRAAVHAAPAARAVASAELPTGSYGVLVRERNEDGQRRRRRRRERAGVAPTAEDELVRWGRHVVDRVRGALGVPPPGGRSPEEALVEAVGRAAGLPEGALVPATALEEREFWLVEGTDEDTAGRLAATARTLGFHARSHAITAVAEPQRHRQRRVILQAPADTLALHPAAQQDRRIGRQTVAHLLIEPGQGRRSFVRRGEALRGQDGIEIRDRCGDGSTVSASDHGPLSAGHSGPGLDVPDDIFATDRGPTNGQRIVDSASFP